MLLRRLPIVLSLVVLTACGPLPDEPTSALDVGGVRYEASRGATLSVDDGQHLVVSGNETAPTLTVHTRGARRADLYFRPTPLDPGETFTMELAGRSGRAEPARTLARVRQRGVTQDHHQLEMDLTGLGARSVTVNFLNAGTSVHEHVQPTGGDEAVFTVGLTEDEPTSFHYEWREIDGKMVLVVEVDYEAEGMPELEGYAYVTPEPGREAIQVTHIQLAAQPAASAAVPVETVRLARCSRGGLRVLRSTIRP